jgi:hypothetical protein
MIKPTASLGPEGWVDPRLNKRLGVVRHFEDVLPPPMTPLLDHEPLSHGRLPYALTAPLSRDRPNYQQYFVERAESIDAPGARGIR